MRKFLVIVGFLGGVFPALQAQVSLLTGRLMNGDTPLAGATIEIKKLNRAVFSGPDGHFQMAGVPAGNQVIRVTSSGFATLIETIRVEGDTVRIPDWQMVPFSTSMEEVVVTGTLKAVQKKDSPIPVEVYTPQFLKKNPVPSVFEALQLVNGVRPQLNCNVCNTGDIHINGLEGPYTMVTIDGMPIVSSLGSVYGLFGIPTQLIDRIEVVKGPASGLYGSEAIGGVINIITRAPEKAPKLAINTLSTNWAEHALDAGMRMKLGAGSQLLSGIHYYN